MEQVGQTVATTNRQTQVRENMDILGACLSSCEDSASQLMDRLLPIIRPQEQPCDPAVKESHDGLVVLASDLRVFHSRAAKMNDILNDILQRLEL